MTTKKWIQYKLIGITFIIAPTIGLLILATTFFGWKLVLIVALCILYLFFCIVCYGVGFSILKDKDKDRKVNKDVTNKQNI